MKSAIAIRHVAFEDAGVLEDALAEAGYELTYREAGVDNLWDGLHADLLIVLGGPIGVYEQEAYPFLQTEIDLLSRRLGADLPMLGICLGAQLIAGAAGIPVLSGDAGKEIGWKPLTIHDPALAELNGVPVLHWHGDTWVRPPEMNCLASTDQYPNQAFSFGPKVLGLQFHTEVTARNFERWLIGHACELSAAGISPVSLRRDAALYAAGLEAAGRALFRRWLSGLD